MPTTKPLRLVFAVAATFAIVMALLPKPPSLPTDQLGDKFQHMMAFAVLALLARFAWRDASAWRILERLSFLGALIEVFQSIPSLHRDCDPADWIADTIAAGVVLALLALRREDRARREELAPET